MPRISLIILSIYFIFGCVAKNSQQLTLDSQSKSEFTYRGLVQRSLKLKFELDKAEISSVTAKISADYEYTSPLNFEWRLGDGVKLIDGPLKGTVENLKKNQSLEFKIKVTGFNSDINRFIRFETVGTDSARRVFVDGILSSHLENSFESIVQEIEKHKKENP